MAIALRPAPDDHVALDFGPDDHTAVAQAIAALYGEVARKWYGASAKVSFGGEWFTLEDDDGAARLIASSPAGIAMLTALSDHLA